jgi:hypothetical protein
MAVLVLILHSHSSVNEYENGDAPDDAVLVGFVELGRFLGQ